MERYSRILGTDQSLSGLASNLVRAEYRPVFLKKFSREVIFKGRILVMNAPAKSFSAGEQEVLKTFMDQGGLLIWVVGWEERFASESFLNELGLVLADVPLGPTSQTLPSENAWFQEAWLIKIQKPAKVLCYKWNYPVIVTRSFGKGGIVLIGDSYFLLNKNLEGIHSYQIKNILFLKDLLERFSEGTLWH
jgi:hypothetical protein